LKLLTDIFDRGAKRNTKQEQSFGNYLTLIISTSALIASFNNGILELLSRYAGILPILIKLVPIIVMIVLLILSVNTFMKKKVVKNVATYTYSNFLRQASKVAALLSVVSITYSAAFLYNKVKPFDQPLIVIIKGIDGKPMKQLNLRVFDEQKRDISKEFIQTDTESGMAMITSESEINRSCFLYMSHDGKPVYVSLDEAKLAPESVFNNKDLYYIILK
jgi:hypothetical protein